jgi:cell division protein ZapA
MESSTPEKQPVRVTILSRPYTLLASGDPREVEQVAASVNDLMLSIAAKSPNADSTRIAVLACLHLADKLHEVELQIAQARQDSEGHAEAVDTRLREFERQFGELKQSAAMEREEMAERVRELELELSRAKEQAGRKNEELAGAVEQLLAAVEGR